MKTNKELKTGIYNQVKVSVGGGWPERDSLPTGDPIGDVDPTQESDPMEEFVKADKEYMEAIRRAGKHIQHVVYGEKRASDIPSALNCCSNPANHKQIWLVATSYRQCSVCKADLGDWK